MSEVQIVGNRSKYAVNIVDTAAVSSSDGEALHPHLVIRGAMGGDHGCTQGILAEAPQVIEANQFQVDNHDLGVKFHYGVVNFDVRVRDCDVANVTIKFECEPIGGSSVLLSDNYGQVLLHTRPPESSTPAGSPGLGMIFQGCCGLVFCVGRNLERLGLQFAVLL